MIKNSYSLIYREKRDLDLIIINKIIYKYSFIYNIILLYIINCTHGSSISTILRN